MCENGHGIDDLALNIPLGVLALFSNFTFSSSLFWHCRLGHPYISKFQKLLLCLSLFEFLYKSCQMGRDD